MLVSEAIIKALDELKSLYEATGDQKYLNRGAILLMDANEHGIELPMQLFRYFDVE